MAYTESDRVYLRHYLGFGAIFLQADPRLENAITASQSISDGGTRPDNTTELYVKSLVYGQASVAGPPAIPAMRGLLTIEANIANLDTQQGALGVETIKIDSARETARLRQEGRRLCHSLARMLGLRGVRADVFSPAPIVLDSDPFGYNGMSA